MAGRFRPVDEIGQGQEHAVSAQGSALAVPWLCASFMYYIGIIGSAKTAREFATRCRT